MYMYIVYLTYMSIYMYICTCTTHMYIHLCTLCICKWQCMWILSIEKLAQNGTVCSVSVGSGWM